MTLRTPRRRISPRTKRRCRAIKDFVRRALGTSSQPGTKTSSSTEVCVSDLKSQILGIEQQLHNVSQQCRDLTYLDNSFRKESENSMVQVQQDDETVENTENSDSNVKDVQTKLLYKLSNSKTATADKNDISRHEDTDDMASANQSVAQSIQDFQFKQKNIEYRKRRRQRNELDLVNQRRSQSKYKPIEPIYSTSSFHSLVESGNKHCSKPEYSSHRHEKRHSRKEYNEPYILKKHGNRESIKKVLRTRGRELDERHGTKGTNRVYSEFDKDFIADIIKRQYRPVKIFGRRGSDFSQFSAPVCRDQELLLRNEIQEGVDLCSCCFNDSKRKKQRYVHHSDLSDMRSICDTRLYSSKQNRRHKLERNIDDYNNSALYDVVPVKEKSSPKARRKFTEDNMIAYQCKEVPPSPKSNRPRLNLKVQQYADYEESLYHGRQQNRKKSPTRNVRKKVLNTIESDASYHYYQRTQPEISNSAKSRKPVIIQEDVGTMSSLQYPNNANEQVNIPNNDTTLNTTSTDSTADKADKTLSEIKDILKSFLLEIKKESTYSDKSEDMSKIENKQLLQHQEHGQANSNMIPNSGDSFNNYNARQCGMQPFMPAFTNPCCYPMLPMCPMNCMQNGYVIPSPSYTCNVCAKTSKEHSCPEKHSSCNKNKPSEEVNKSNETQELIKEIYKFVSQNRKSPRTKQEQGDECKSVRSTKGQRFDKKFVTNRYAGGSTKASKHDATVGTPYLKCLSKSCEAVGSKTAPDIYSTNASYSDTIIERLSLEATQSSTETDVSIDVREEKVKRGKLTKVLNPLRLFRKKKKDMIEEMCETESAVDVRRRPPFKQHIQSFSMHGQEYFHPPPAPGPHCCHARPECFGHYDPRDHYPPPPPPPDFYNHHQHHYDHAPAHQYNPKCPTAPPYPNYDPHYNQVPPQVPLCLKEVEVKSTATQSDRKESILQKFSRKVPQQRDGDTGPVKGKTNFWKSLQEKANQDHKDTMNFSLKTQKELAHGDMNLKNAMLKKMFYKKNPFSPRNLIVRTLLGKDKSSFGSPPKIYRPKMFL